MSLISDSLRRVAEQRAGRKQPPVVPRRLAGQEDQHKKRRLLLLGLTILLAVAVIGVVVYGVVQWRTGKSKPAEAVTASPQKVIFDKITPPAKPLRSAADSEAPPSRDGTVEQRTPVKPAFLLKLRNSIATSRAPSISKIECGTSGSVM